MDLYIPKVSISEAYDIGSLLEGMGLADLLYNQADFSGITHEAQLKVSKVSVSRSCLFFPAKYSQYKQ